jgi:hypothetical protein
MEEIVIDDCSTLPQLSRIEMPCYMKDKDTMMRALGGEDVVQDSLRNDAVFLHANLSQHENPPRYCFQGKPVVTNGFLVKVRRKKKSNTGSDPTDITATVLGRVTRSFVFDTPVGCQVSYSLIILLCVKSHSVDCITQLLLLHSCSSYVHPHHPLLTYHIPCGSLTR